MCIYSSLLASFTQHKYFEFYLCCCFNSSFLYIPEQYSFVWINHKGIQAAYRFGPVQKSCHEHMCLSLCMDKCAHFFVVNAQSRMAGFCGRYIFTFSRNCQTVLQSDQTILYFMRAVFESSSSFLHSPALGTVNFSDFSHSKQRHLTMVADLYFPTNNDKHLFMSLSAIRISSLVKCQFKSFAHYFMLLLFF